MENSCFYGHCFPSGTSGKEPACQCRRLKTWVQSLGQQDPLEEEKAIHSRFLPESHGQGNLAGYSPRGSKESDTTEAT